MYSCIYNNQRIPIFNNNLCYDTFLGNKQHLQYISKNTQELRCQAYSSVPNADNVHVGKMRRKLAARFSKQCAF